MDRSRKLTSFEESVIINGHTEPPFTGNYVNEFADGIYCCRQCGALLYRSESKFHSGCGWPSFDSEIEGAVEHKPDPDGIRTGIICANCGGHLGHIFKGEGFTPADVRHCVNSVSLLFIPSSRMQTAVFAGGCFWGIEYRFQSENGVLETTTGYAGGNTDNPTYEEVCTGTTGHAEAVEVVFDTSVTSYKHLAKLFFEIHDPTTIDRQGPDIGTQYRSVAFYSSDEQKETLDSLVAILQSRGYKIVTRIEPLENFWPAENYHQDYYRNNGAGQFCQVRINRFGTSE